MSSPTRFSAKKRNARHINKEADTLESSSEAREAASVETQQVPTEKADVTGSPVVFLQFSVLSKNREGYTTGWY